MKKIQQREKVINLCGSGSCCPLLVISKKEVKIGEKGNLCRLRKSEWGLLKKLIRENKV